MHKILNGFVGVEQGEVLMFSDFDVSGPMWVGIGNRHVEKLVYFSERFRKPPSVTAWISLLDAKSNSNLRYDLKVSEVTNQKAKLSFVTWGDSQFARIRMGWSAIGELRHADDWDIEE